MKKIYYWSPFIGNIATIKAVINSAHSLSKFSNNSLIPTIINSCGEWNTLHSELSEKKINVKKFKNNFQINTKVQGFLKSRLTYIKVFLSCFFLLKKSIISDKPDFLIVHLITSLPIFLYLVFNFNTKLIIRVSGKVKMNIFRKMLWKMAGKKIFLISCPTIESKNELVELNLVDKSKIIYLPDPIIDINYINIKKKEKEVSINKDRKFFVSIGRYTKQKNHELAIKCFYRICKKYENINFLIIGNGELKKEYRSLINKYNLKEKIFLINYKNNIFNYLNNSLGLISTSLWEDPGFVMIEAAASNTFVISSDCPSGPKEFLFPDAGLLFENNNIKSLENKVVEYLDMDPLKIKKFKTNAKKKAIKFTKLRHYNILSNYLNQ